MFGCRDAPFTTTLINDSRMSITLTADTARSLLVATAVGDLSLAELKDVIRTVRTGERREWALLFDATLAKADITAGQVRALAMTVGSVLRLEGPRAPVALVASEDALFGVMRMYQMLCEGEGFDGIGVFRTRHEAEAWLGPRVAV
jgi:hypothetical protein